MKETNYRLDWKTKETFCVEGISVSWEPIGAYSGVPFGGTFDGKNHRIKNIKKICKTIREESYENR